MNTPRDRLRGGRVWLTSHISIARSEIELSAIRSQGPGGQNVNKVSSAVHLRFDINASSLPPHVKAKLKALRDHRITREGIVIIKAQQTRSREQNTVEAIERLAQLLQQATARVKPRRATKPSRRAKAKRMDKKTKHGQKKQLRGKVNHGY